MTAVARLARVHLRRRWAALVLLGVMTGLAGGAALGSFAAARRTSTAYERLENATALGDVRITTFGTDLADEIARLPVVRDAWIAKVAVGRVEGAGMRFLSFVAGPRRPPGLVQPIPIAGRLFRDDAPDEIVVAESISAPLGASVGQVMRLRLLTAEEFTQFDTGFGEPDGPLLSLRVVGIVRLASGEDGLTNVFGSPALAARLGPDLVPGHAVFARLRDGDASVPALRAQLDDLARRAAPLRPGAEEFEPIGLVVPGAARAAAATPARVLVGGLLAFGGAALLAGTFALAQTFARYHAIGAEDHAVEAALGLTRGQRVLARAAPAALPGALGALSAVGVAIALSPASPIGSVARFEPSPGADVNAALLAAGGGALFAIVVLVDVLTAGRAARPARSGAPLRPSPVAERAGSVGATPPVAIGLRFAFEPGRGPTAVPVRSALVGAVLGIAGIVAVAAFAASIDRLVSTPSRYGWQGDLIVSDVRREHEQRLLSDRRVAALATMSLSNARLEGVGPVDAVGFEVLRGSIGWTMVEGRMPANQDEVALGRRLAARAGAEIGAALRFVDPRGGGSRTLTVVGIGLGPTAADRTLGDNLVVTPEGLAKIAQTQPFRQAYVRVPSGVAADAFAADLEADMEVSTRELPAQVEGLRQLGRLPELLGLLLTALTLAAAANALVVGARRRRRDFAVLRTIGFTGRMLRTAVRTTATATMAFGVIAGIPLGLAVSAASWRAVAHTTAVAGDLALPGTLLVSIVPAAAAASLALSVVPARRAARLGAAEVLRSA